MKQDSAGKLTVRNMVFIALFAAIICVLAPFSFNVGPIPITLGTFAIYLAGALLGSKKGVIAVSVYILLGAIGLPVFSGFKGGFGVLFGVTGGYIIGYILMALLTGVFSEKGKKLLPVGMVLGTVALYAFGTVWYMVLTGSDLATALMLCAVPFLPGDALKIAAVSAIAIPLKSRTDIFM